MARRKTALSVWECFLTQSRKRVRCTYFYIRGEKETPQ